MYRSVFVCLCCCILAACVGEGDEQEVKATSGGEGSDVRGTVLTQVPNPCELFTHSDAQEVLGEKTEPGRRFDAGGWSCVYDSATFERGKERRRLTFDLHVGRGETLGALQAGFSGGNCSAEVEKRFEDLGRDSILYTKAGNHCRKGLFVWVLTHARFRGKLHPDHVREVEGPIHFLVTVSPPGNIETTTSVLRRAAKRGLRHLGK